MNSCVNFFKTTLSKKEQLMLYKDEINRYNYNSLRVVALIGLVISAVLFILSLPFIGILKLFLPYTMLTLFFSAINILVLTVIKKHNSYALPFYYVLTFSVMMLSIIMGTFESKTTNATTFLLFLLFLLLFPMFAIDFPWRLIICNVFFSVLFCILDIISQKSQQLLPLDISNTVVVCILSAIFTVVAVQRNLDNFKISREQNDKLNEKNFLINAIPVGVAIYEVKGNQIEQIFTNDEFYRLFDDTKENRSKRNNGNFLNSIHPDDREDLKKVIKSVIDGKNYVVEMCRSQKGDGSYIWVRFASCVAKREKDYIEVFSTYSSMEEEIKNKQASEAKTAFLSRTSHDIRTPMNAIIGITNLAKKENDIKIIREYLDYIDSSSTFLLGLINDVLDLSKIESGDFVLIPAPYSIDEFNANIHMIIEPLMKEKNINFIYQMDKRIKCFLTDKLRFNQIFFNLLSNASKFTPENGTVEFISEAVPCANSLNVRFIVKDNGIGMSEEYQKEMFTPFIQDYNHMHEQQNGTGLGLPIVKSIVDAMNGTITVHSKQNAGTKIIVELLLETVDEEQTASYASKDVTILDGMKILIAEDNDLNILVAKKLLESKNCILTIVQNGKACLEAFENSEINYFDAILMDVRMPVMDGIEATIKIRALNRSDAKTIPIIAMTADAFSEEKKRTIEAGMNDHLSKPVNSQLLFEALAKFKAT